MPRLIYIPKKNNIFPVNYGRLYNWNAATDVRDIANIGWHVPIHDEYNTMFTYVGLVGGQPKLKEAGIQYWSIANGTNDYLFNLRGAGYRQPDDGTFVQIKVETRLWTASSFNLVTKYAPQITVSGTTLQAYASSPINSGFSVRLVKDSTTLTHGQTGTYTGNDGKIYRTICIGTQEWTADNLAEEQYRNGDPIPIVTDNTAWAALTTGAACSYLNDDNNI